VDFKNAALKEEMVGSEVTENGRILQSARYEWLEALSAETAQIGENSCLVSKGFMVVDND